MMPLDKRVLIIDDELGFIHIFKRSLAAYGITDVTAVTSGEEARKYIAGSTPYELRQLPDLLFIDLKMSGMSGFELMTWLQAEPRYRHIPVIVLSGSSDPADRQEAAALGAKAFYAKPQQTSGLQHLVQSIWEERIRPGPTKSK